MGDDGGTSGTLLTCPRDGVDTRLQCAGCEAPICPSCYVRTAVGLRCPPCGAASGPRIAQAGPTRRWPLVAAAGAAVAVVLGGLAFALLQGGGATDVERDAEPAPPPRAQVVVGSGQLPNGAPWRLDARRGDADALCTTFSVGSANGQERCEPLVLGRHLIRTDTGTVRSPSTTVYVTWGLVSERTERVRVTPEGEPPWEVAVLGADARLGARFFVSHVARNVPVTFASLTSDGTELDRQTRPPRPER